MAADARLDDRDALARRLGLTEAEARRCDDADLILRAYLRWEERCAEEIVGAFAFAVWDPRRGVLTLARDHMGLRPLVYQHDGDCLRFASDPEAILACGGVRREVDELCLVARLVDNFAVQQDRSPFAGIAKLRAGTVLTVRPGAAPRTVTYWEPGPRDRLRLRGADEYAEALRDVHRRVVRASAGGEGRVGAHLSGGLDSGSVAVIAHETLRERGSGLARGFSWSPAPDAEEPAGDERARVQDLARQLDVAVYWSRLTGDDLQADFERDVALVPNESRVYEPAIVAEARRVGVRAILSGWGGDEAASFGGRHLQRLARGGHPVELWRFAAAGARRRGLRGPAVARGAAGAIALATVIPVLPDRVRRPIHRRLRVRQPPPPRWELLHRDALEVREAGQRWLRVRADPRDMQIAALRNGHLTARAEAWAHATAGTGVEYRFPMLDVRLLEFCLTLPPDVWGRDGYERWIFRRAMQPVLGAEACWGLPKSEPARQRTYWSLFANGWEPALRPGMPPHASMVREHRRQMQRLIRDLLQA